MNFEIVHIGDSIHVSVNGVVSAAHVRKTGASEWVVFVPRMTSAWDTLEDALRIVADNLGDWCTAAEAADYLVEKMGNFDKVSAHDICLWARNGLLPGSMKITGKGGAGQGGSWRIPRLALDALAERRGR